MGNASIKMEGDGGQGQGQDGSLPAQISNKSSATSVKSASASGSSSNGSPHAAVVSGKTLLNMANTTSSPYASDKAVSYTSEKAVSETSQAGGLANTASYREAVTVQVAEEPAGDEEQEQEQEQVDDFYVLLQFIPYYGQGDSGNDTLVRSTLMNINDYDVEKVDEYGNTLLMLACQYKHQDLVRILLNKGADANAKNHSGAYCIHFPCYKDTLSRPIAKMLLQSGANPEVAEASYGCTPLHYCASSGDVDFCKLLLQFGAFVGTRDFYNYTAVDYAREAGMQEAAAFLQKKLLAITNNGAPGLIAMGVSQRGGFVFDNLKPEAPACDVFVEAEWVSSVDPSTGGRYFINNKSGECLWESDFEFLKLQKMLESPKKQQPQQQPQQPEYRSSAKEATRMQLARADSLKGFGRSGSLAPSPVSRKSSRQDVRGERESPRGQQGQQGGGGGLDGATVQKLISEAQLQAAKILEDEREKFRNQLVEKNGLIAKLECENESLNQSKAELEKNVNGLESHLSKNMTDSEVLQSVSDNLAREKEEAAALKFQLAAAKVHFAENLSRAEMMSEAASRQTKEAEERAEEALSTMRSLEQEVLEGRDFKQMNAQLMRDLHKEQMIRKKLHNEIEDMKGKIRVYVRIRPFSNSEQQRGCSEVCAVLCFAVCVVLCCTMLWYCVVLCCVVLRCAVLCCAVLCCVVLCCVVLCYAMLCYAILCHTMLYYTILYYTILYYAILCNPL
jgi:hypothetical protein